MIAGEYPGHPDKTVARAKLTELLALGVTTIIDLTEPSEGLRDYDALLRTLPGGRFVHHLRCPIPDQDIADPATIHRMLDHLDVALADTGVVYLHCWGGIGRTGMIAGCALVRHGMPPSGALWATEHGWQTTAKSKEARHQGRTSPETVEQMRIVAEWEREEIARAKARGETRLRVIHIDAPPLPAALRAVEPVDPREAERRDRARGCLLGGAVGDALGWPVEFTTIGLIRERFGPDGITELQPVAKTGVAEITDDTQMTLFTAEGLLRGICRGNRRGIGGPHSTMRQAYRRWYLTQVGHANFREAYEGELRLLIGETAARHGIFARTPTDDARSGGDVTGWLIRQKALHAKRAPGITCMGALHPFSYDHEGPALNTSKGNGGVMRVAPIGLIADAEAAFDLACYAAGITHGHPTGVLASGVFAVMIHALNEGASMMEAVEMGRGMLAAHEARDQTDAAIAAAVRRANGRRKSTSETVMSLGEGKVAESALAIAIFCALRGEAEEDCLGALRLSVNHSGDSDSTGSMTGQLLGCRYGGGWIPAGWLAALELREVISAVADDLVTTYREGDEWWERWPGS